MVAACNDNCHGKLGENQGLYKVREKVALPVLSHYTTGIRSNNLG